MDFIAFLLSLVFCQKFCSSGGLKIALVCALSAAVVQGIPIADFYPFGASNGDHEVPKNMDDEYASVEVTPPVRFNDTSHTSVHISENGIITFTNPHSIFEQFMSFPPSGEWLLAPYYADVDNRGQGSGSVWYRVTTNASLLTRVKQDIPSKLIRSDFNPSWLLIATWDHVGFYYQRAEKTNTFQCIITSDGNQSFTIFFYADGLIQWTTGDGTGGVNGIGGFPAFVGLSDGSGLNHLELQNSRTFDVINIGSIYQYGIAFRLSGEILQANLSDSNDSNECLVLNGGCAQICKNTVGTYSCSCEPGYTLTLDGKGCVATINGCGLQGRRLSAVAQALEAVQYSGASSSFPAPSCNHVIQHRPWATSGYYWVRRSQGEDATLQFCSF